MSHLFQIPAHEVKGGRIEGGDVWNCLELFRRGEGWGAEIRDIGPAALRVGEGQGVTKRIESVSDVKPDDLLPIM